jgi:hypothetical protein
LDPLDPDPQNCLQSNAYVFSHLVAGTSLLAAGRGGPGQAAHLRPLLGPDSLVSALQLPLQPANRVTGRPKTRGGRVS